MVSKWCRICPPCSMAPIRLVVLPYATLKQWFKPLRFLAFTESHHHSGFLNCAEKGEFATIHSIAPAEHPKKTIPDSVSFIRNLHVHCQHPGSLSFPTPDLWHQLPTDGLKQWEGQRVKGVSKPQRGDCAIRFHPTAKSSLAADCLLLGYLLLARYRFTVLSRQMLN